ncbi:MAG: WS/DGAT domain-containing protein, partial [Burkholderiaceae bacterium]
GKLRLAATRGSQPFTAVHTPMNEPVRTARSFASLALAVHEMRAVSKAFDATINDVAVTIVDAGLHRYLESIGHPIAHPLVAMCPVSLREAGDQEATTKVSAIFVPLGAPAASIGDRMERVMAAISAAKSDVTAMTKDAAMMYAISAFSLGEAADLARVGRWTGHMANFVLSNVPGAREQLYLSGAPLTGMFPVSTMGGGIGLNVTLASSADVMGFGFIGNGEMLPQLNKLASFTRAAFDELKAMAAGQAVAAEIATTKASRRPRRRAVKKAGKSASRTRPPA